MKASKEIVIVRHVIALDKEKARENNIPDHLRELTKKGRHKFKKFLFKNRKYLSHCEALISSPLARAYQTAEIVQKVCVSLDILKEAQLEPSTAPENLIRFLLSLPYQKTILVSHDPLLSLTLQNILRMDTKTFKLKKGAIVILRLLPDQTFELRQWLNP